MSASIVIIAEAGVNHNGDIDIAKKLVSVAAKAGADIIKFQTFKAEDIVSNSAEKAEYQKAASPEGEGQLEMLKKLELSEDDHVALYDFANDQGIQFLSTPFGIESVDALDKFNVPFYKVPSGELTNGPLLEHIATKAKPVVMSTGMADLDEIQDAIEVLTNGGIPLLDITLLKCTTAYPTPYESAHLAGMDTLARTFRTKVGYSDHTMGIEVPIAAAALGATIIEKHITLDRSMTGPDHAASIEPNELEQMVSSIRNIEQAMGNGDIGPSNTELLNRTAARRSIHSVSALAKGKVLESSDLVMKRPGNGISPMQLKELIGKRLKHDVGEDEMLSWEDVE